ncbi:unnamed protein product [Paramecium primaurelia]|uniref:Transmembrane protein n=1 Tax=Paramecium primaurelia TaxID=5886 RepID=A0A8S1NGC8_PARPR|nr:unnamed protein product [Paramecium primaurelia]
MVFLIVIVTSQCPCSEYSYKICDHFIKCSWNGEFCQDLQCHNLNQTLCYGDQTNYQCKWNQKFEECEDFDYQNCDDISEKSDCLNSNINNFSCSWTSSESCKKFDCLIDKQCPIQKCSFINGTCSYPTNELNCSAIPQDQCNSTFNGKGLSCYLNDFGQCKLFDNSKLICPQYYDSQSYCKINNCIYENNICKEKQCTDIKLEQECQYTLTNQTFITTCFWSNNSCQEVQENNLYNFSKDDCQIKTYFTYSWSENYDCVKCSLLKEEESSQILLIVLGITIPIFCIFTCFMIWWCKKKQKFCFKGDIKETRKNYQEEIQKDEKKQLDNNFTERYLPQQKPEY